MQTGFFTTSSGDLCRDTSAAPVVRERFAFHYGSIETGAALRATLRAGPYAWPGGYPLYFITSDGAALSFDAVRENFAQCIRAIRDHNNDGWRIVACDVNYEDNELTCDHSGAHIPSAFGE